MHSCIHLTLVFYDHKSSKRLDLVAIWSFDAFSSLCLRFLIIKPISHLTMVCYHQNPIRRTLGLTIRTGYFWLTMEMDCCQFVQRCLKCQIHGDLIHVPPSELHALTSPWPFSVWGIDIIGKISPKSSNGHEFILVSIDYFT